MRGGPTSGFFNAENKPLLILGGVAAASILLAVVFAKSSAKASSTPVKNYGIKVGPQCSSFEITDSNTIAETISRLVDSTAAAGAVDPFAVTTAWLRGAAGQCKSFPEQTRNPGEASLYRQTFITVIKTMKDKNLISQEMSDTYMAMINAWAQSQGVT